MKATVPPVLADQYDIVREIGAGGMATVYLAHDRKHDRDVALKVVRPDLVASLEEERFRREIAIAARLQHPNLLAVYDSGATDGLLWYTMPFVEGESLRDRLVRERQLPVSEVIRIGREVTAALAFAHAQGVLHRDVKPENILLDATGRAMLADFGIARALVAADRNGTLLTATGVTVGTPAYMSPEQAAGDHALDARSDIYSLGCVLYEMLAGEPPFTGPTPQAVIAKRFAVTPTPLRAVRDTVPAALEAAVARAMHRTPADRFPSAVAFGAALADAATADPARDGQRTEGSRRRLTLVAAALAVVLLGATAVWWARRAPSAASVADAAAAAVPALAVLPFENVGDSVNADFADAVADEVRGKLTAFPSLRVIASASSGQYRARTKPDSQIARELGARYLLYGKVRWIRSPNGQASVRVEPQLVKFDSAAAPSLLWSEPITGELDDIFRLQGDIATRVASKLDIVLVAGDSTRLRAAPTRSIEAYEYYLRARAVALARGSSPAALKDVIAEYERAVGRDPDYARAWAGMSIALSALYYIATPDAAVAARAQQALDRARALAPGLPEMFRARGMYASRVIKDERQAVEAYRDGLRVAPRDVSLLTAAGVSWLALGEPDSAIAALREAERIDPLAPALASSRLQAALRMHDTTEARAAGDRALSLAPASISVRQYRVMVELQAGRLDRARTLLAATPAEVSRTALIAYMTTYYDLYWVLDEAQQQTLRAMTPADFDDDRAAWALGLAGAHALRGDRVATRAFADSARRALEAQLAESPDDAQLRAALGVALAFRGAPGDSAAAVREGERAATLAPLALDTWTGAYVRHQLARVYTLVGDHASAVRQIEPLLRLPYVLTPGWLRIDPSFGTLRNDPAFRRLTGAA